MKLLKSHPILSIANSFVIDSPSPSNLSYLWNYGSLLGLCLVMQIITGVTLAMHYCPSIDFAFLSVEHIIIINLALVGIPLLTITRQTLGGLYRGFGTTCCTYDFSYFCG